MTFAPNDTSSYFDYVGVTSYYLSMGKEGFSRRDALPCALATAKVAFTDIRDVAGWVGSGQSEGGYQFGNLAGLVGRERERERVNNRA